MDGEDLTNEGISLDEAMAGLEPDASQSDENSKKKHKLREGRHEQTEIDGRRKYFELRNKWSDVIIYWIYLLIIVNTSLVVLTGLGVLNFTSYKWLITSVTTETFLQIVGLGYVAAKYLFNDQKINGDK